MIFPFPCAQQDSPKPLVQFVDPRRSTISVAAVALLDHPEPRDLQLSLIGLRALSAGSNVYPSGKIRQITEGRGITAYLGQDVAVVSLTVPANAASDPQALLISLLTEPALSDSAISSAILELQRGTSDYWVNAVNGHRLVVGAATRDEILDSFRRIFRLDHLLMGESGPIPLGKMADRWLEKAREWPAPSEPGPGEQLDVPPLTGNRGRVSTGELIGPRLGVAGPEFAPSLLALYGLGSGKCSSLFRISREKHAWSYRQESLLTGDEGGFIPQLFVAMSPDLENAKHLDALRAEVIEDVKGWTDQNLADALGMAEANLVRDIPYGPLVFEDEPVGPDPERSLAFALYWKAKTGADWSASDLLEELRKVDLPTLKSAATKLVESSKIRYLPAVD